MAKKGAAIILGGGRSSRIGQDKCLLELGGKPLWRIVADKLESSVKEIIIATDICKFSDGNGRFKIVKDEVPHLGPLGGILAGLSISSQQYNLVVGCDMPFINIGLINFLFNCASGFDAVVPYSGKGIEPLHSIYSKDCIPVIKERLEHKERKVGSFLADISVNYVGKEEIKSYDPDFLSFFNINTAQEWKKAQEIFQSQKR